MGHLVRQLHVPLVEHEHLEQQYGHAEPERHERQPLEPLWCLIILHYLRLVIFLDRLRKSAECSMCHGYNTVSANMNDNSETINTATGTHFVQRGGSSFICYRVRKLTHRRIHLLERLDGRPTHRTRHGSRTTETLLAREMTTRVQKRVNHTFHTN